jgi:signal transduction histidine kinase
MPLCDQQSMLGVLAVARNKDDSPFDASHLALMRDFADHAVVALRLSESREQAREMSLIADRERIAHDLHDHVIQRLFAAGMDLQGTIARSHSTDINNRLNHTVDDLQSTINEIRTTIFALQSPTAIAGGFRQRIQNVVAELTGNRDIETSVHLSGPLIVVGQDVAEQAIAVIAEGVSNAVRHSGAEHLTVGITVADELTVDIADDGCGIEPTNQRRSGLANFERRAASVSGTCSIDSHPGGGTRIRWVAPLATR